MPQVSFNDLIGQEQIKNRFNFYIRSMEADQKVPPLMLTGGKGAGKTEFARAFGAKVNRKFIEINASSIKNAQAFFDQIFTPHINGEEVIVFIDEAHDLPSDLVTAFLSIFNSDGEDTYRYDAHDEGGETYLFEFKKQIFMFATTDEQKIFEPMRDRLTKIDFRRYTNQELALIMAMKASSVEFTSDLVLQEVSSVLRGNPRSAALMAKEIERMAAIYQSNVFEETHWNELKSVLGILPLGINESERQVIDYLGDRGEASLTELSSGTGLARGALQGAVEKHLLREGLIRIDGKRILTDKGRRVKMTLDESY